MDVLAFLLPAIGWAIGAAVAVLGLQYVHLPEKAAPTLDGHAHRFDTMLSDGKGWRCGICHQLKGR